MPLILAGPYTQLVAPTQRGFTTAFCQRQTGRWSPTNGWTFDQEFRGLSETTMQALANQYANAGIEYSITIQGGIATMTTVDTTGNVTIDVWEINASRQNLSIFGNPKIVAAVSENNLKVISRAFQEGTTLAEAVTSLNSDNPGTTYTAPNLATANATTVWLWDQCKNDKITDYITDTYTLKHTTNASNRGYYNVADVNVNRIYTQAQFYSEIRNNGYWIFPAPNEIIGALDVVFSSFGSIPTGYYAGALKGGASRCTTAENRVNITTDYTLGVISGYPYDLAS